MKYKELQIQTQREFPSNMRTPGFGWLVRAGYINRENEIMPLGNHALSRLRKLAEDRSFLSTLSLPVIGNEEESFFPLSTGSQEVIHCPSCEYTATKELARSRKVPFSKEEPLPVKKVSTPECDTIESLAGFLGIPKEKTAKALMYMRVTENQFIFVVVRGDMNLSEAKLRNAIGDIRLATPDEIIKAGAAPGYASPIGLQNAIIVVDDLIPQSPNLVAGANETDYHLQDTNCGRDYSPDLVTDITLVGNKDFCINCGGHLSEVRASRLKTGDEVFFENILYALAESHHDDKGLTLPPGAAPFDAYLMHVPGKKINTAEKSGELYNSLQGAGVAVLFDDRDERAGVKFNDADLIGCPVRITIGEKALQNGMVELKGRKEKEYKLVKIDNLIEEIHNR